MYLKYTSQVSEDIFRKDSTVTLEQKSIIEELKEVAEFLYSTIGWISENCHGKRESAIAKTKLQECVMWAVKAATAKQVES